jgi:2-oxoglutarate dehydrogenase E1 component
VREAYLDRLLEMKGVTREEADAITQQRRQQLEKELGEARSADYQRPDHTRKISSNTYGGCEKDALDVETSVPKERLQELLQAQTVAPEGFTLHKQLGRFVEARKNMARGEAPLNWGAAEALALASLSSDGVPIRLSGQDSERGTFTHRHAVWHDIETDETYTPLHHLPMAEGQKQARIELVNSPLSEIGPLGLEYGYSLDALDALVIWEAQFGDFWNCAQVIFDQFIASAEDKWQHLSGLVMLLPHGMEGMGPEHSSARLERFLMACAEDNIQVTYPTTPAQYFHLLRRQVLRKWRKPLVVMSPKSLLRHLECVSPLEDLSEGRFQRVIPEVKELDASKVTKVLLCTGKIFYELDKKREDLGRDDVAIVRLEQLYPFPEKELKEALAPYSENIPVVWVQEEPMNMGAWRFMRITLGQKAFGKHAFSGVSRPASASPATGSSGAHKKEQELLLQEAFSTGKKRR